MDWKFNPNRVPWYGGFGARLVSNVKRSLKKPVGKSKLLEIELILNSRPLCYLYDADQEDILTPNRLLYGRNLKFINYRESYVVYVNSPDGYFNKGIQYLNRVLKHFWNRW